MARMVVIYHTPKNVEAFDRHYFDVHIPLAKKLPVSGNTRSATALSQYSLDRPMFT